MTRVRRMTAVGFVGLLVGIPLASGQETNRATDEIVVTATRVGVASYRVPADVTVIPVDPLRKPGVANYQQALSGASSVKLTPRQENEMAVPGIEVRGLGSNPMSGGNVLILLDGIPQRRLSFGGPYVGSLPSDAITHMELVKGPVASLYGRGAMSGALQLFSSPGTPDWEGAASGTYESTIDQLRSALRISGPLSPARDSTFSLTGSRSVIGGWQPRTDGDREDAYVHMALAPGAADRLNVMAGYVDASQDKAAPVLIGKNGKRLPGIDRDENLAVPGQNSGDVTEYRAAAIWERALSDRLDSKLSLAFWNADTYWKVGRPDDSPATGTIISRSSSNRDWAEDSWFSEYQLAADYAAGEEVAGTLVGGGSLERWTYNNRYQSIWSPGSDAARGILLDLSSRIEPDPGTWIYGPWGELDVEELDYGVFLKNRLAFGRRIDFDLGGRYDGYTREQEDRVRGTGSTMSEDAVSPSAGVAYHFFEEQPEVTTAYASWGKGFWPVYRNVGPAEIAEIPPETSTSYELGLKNYLFARRLVVNMAAYQQERNDVVGTDPTTQKPDNVGDWRITGVELELKARVVGNLDVYGSCTRRSPEIVRDDSAPATEGNDIPLVSEDMFTLGLGYEPLLGWFAGVENRHVGGSYADTANTIRVRGYNLVDARVGYTWKSVTATVFARNLLDEEYFSDVFLGVKNGSAFEGTPRTVGVSLCARF